MSATCHDTGLYEIISTMLVTYIIGSLALIVKPGPDLTCTIATALADGKAKAATLMLGLIAGDRKSVV